MKVLYYNPAINSTEGAAIHARELMKGLALAGAEIVCYPEPTTLQYAKATSKESEKGALLYIKEALRLLRGIYRSINDYVVLNKLSKKHDFDFVFTRNFEFSIAGMLMQKIRGIPLIIEVNALAYLERKRYGENFFIVIRKMFEKYNLEGAFGSYVVSAELLPIIKAEGIEPNHMTVIPNGVDIEAFHPDNKPMAELVNKFPDKCVFGFTGSLKAWHGTDTMVNSFSKLAKLRDDVALMVVGDGDEMNNLKALVKQYQLEDKIYFTGRVNHQQVAECLALLDVTVAPYLDNGDFYFSPLKVYEYMAAGKPVIGSRVGQLRDLLDSSDFGIGVTAGDVDELTSAMDRLAGDAALRKKLSINARATALNHSWQSVARKVIEIYRKEK
jgi:glycosyltransferase involved in cell wall biosynthesis